jgi:hypothetical protein
MAASHAVRSSKPRPTSGSAFTYSPHGNPRLRRTIGAFTGSPCPTRFVQNARSGTLGRCPCSCDASSFSLINGNQSQASRRYGSRHWLHFHRTQ